jgi:hypothetical protein
MLLLFVKVKFSIFHSYEQEDPPPSLLVNGEGGHNNGSNGGPRVVRKLLVHGADDLGAQILSQKLLQMNGNCCGNGNGRMKNGKNGNLLAAEGTIENVDEISDEIIGEEEQQTNQQKLDKIEALAAAGEQPKSKAEEENGCCNGKVTGWEYRPSSINRLLVGNGCTQQQQMNGVSNGKNNLLKYYDVNILITLFDLCS